MVALHPEGVDRNAEHGWNYCRKVQSPSTRRAWIEILTAPVLSDMIQVSPSIRRAWIGISLSLLTKCGYRIYKPGPSGAGDGERKSESGHRIHKKSKIADGASRLPHRAGDPLPQAERGTRTKKVRKHAHRRAHKSRRPCPPRLLSPLLAGQSQRRYA